MLKTSSIPTTVTGFTRNWAEEKGRRLKRDERGTRGREGTMQERAGGEYIPATASLTLSGTGRKLEALTTTYSCQLPSPVTAEGKTTPR